MQGRHDHREVIRNGTRCVNSFLVLLSPALAPFYDGSPSEFNGLEALCFLLRQNKKLFSSSVPHAGAYILVPRFTGSVKANDPFGAVGDINGKSTNWRGYGSQGLSNSGVEDRVFQTPISGTHSSPSICGIVLSSSKANHFLPC